MTGGALFNASPGGRPRRELVPGWMVRLGRLALAAAADDPRAGEGYAPDAALVNFYDADDARRDSMRLNFPDKATMWPNRGLARLRPGR